MEKPRKQVSIPDFKLDRKPYTPKAGDQVVIKTIDNMTRVSFGTIYKERKYGWSVCLKVKAVDISSRWLREKFKEGGNMGVFDAITSAFRLEMRVATVTSWEQRDTHPMRRGRWLKHTTTVYRLWNPGDA